MPPATLLRDAKQTVDTRVGDVRLLSTEYRSVVAMDARIDHTVYVAQQPEHAALNRYVNVLPYDYNLVTVGPDRAYLNASFVREEDRASVMEFNYICSQVGDVCTHMAHCVCVCFRARWMSACVRAHMCSTACASTHCCSYQLSSCRWCAWQQGELCSGEGEVGLCSSLRI